MTLNERRERLFANIMRLRRAERALPRNRDLVAVRADLERELGDTVSRSLAARVLGLTHTALNRWIKRGDVPVVITPDGRKGVPVSALQDLYDAVELERTTGQRTRHTLEPSLRRGYERAAQIDADNLLSDHVEQGADGSSFARRDRHEIAQLRSLAYHRAVARQLRRSQANDALHRVWQWQQDGRIDPQYAELWEEVLQSPVRDIKRIISEDTPFARDLRQNSPFAGTLTEPERRRILRDVG